MPFLKFEKRIRKKIAPGILRFQSMLFLIFEKGMSKNTALGILRFLSMLFLIFEKWNEQKNCARNVKIRKNAFF